MTLPSLQASVDRVYPLVGKNGIKKGFIKNINFQYNLRGENQITTTDEFFFKKEIIQGFQRPEVFIKNNFKYKKLKSPI